jgi:hypothetical protein
MHAAAGPRAHCNLQNRRHELRSSIPSNSFRRVPIYHLDGGFARGMKMKKSNGMIAAIFGIAMMAATLPVLREHDLEDRS